MAKYNLTVSSDDPKELAAHFSIMMGSGAASLTINGITPNMITADDDNTPPNPNAPQFDAAGIPWDDRIHSKNKGMTNDGMWRKKRGVADTTVAAVEMELKARGAQPMYMPPPASTQPPQQYAPPQNYVPPSPPQYSPPPQNYQPPPYTPPPQNYQPPPPVAPVAAMDFTQFMQHISTQLAKRDPSNNQPLIDGNYLAGVCQRISAQTQRPFSAITDLANNPDCIPFAVQLIQGDGRW